jgi:hypothetical protein
MSDKKDPARFRIKFEFSIAEYLGDYNVPQKVRALVEEGLPVGVDAEQYLRKRIGEEIRRNFSNLKIAIDNAPEVDPLEA